MHITKTFFSVLALTLSMSVIGFTSCEEINPEEQGGEQTEEPTEEPAEHLIKLVSPEDSAEFDLDKIMKKSIDFEWKNLDTVPKYKLKISVNADLSNGKMINMNDANPFSLKAIDLDAYLREAGVPTDGETTLYWQVHSAAVIKADSEIRSIKVSRMSYGPNVSPSERKAETITRKVAILIEDPVYNGYIEEYKGKRVSEITHKGWGYKWNNPREQMIEFERDMEASSHHVVEYEVVQVVEADRFWSYFKNSINNKQYLTVDTLVNYYLRENPVDPADGKKWIDKLASYDYLAMLDHYGYTEMIDRDELHEVWVYTTPASGMYESRLIGENAFWCNSPGISKFDGAKNKALCCVMFCNYERTTDLAMHSYAHRVESIMSMVYARSNNGWDYASKRTKSQLSNWELFSASNKDFEKFDHDHAHIGLCHYPPNSADDVKDNYNYSNGRFIYTYADTWQFYPYLSEDYARRVNCNEWADQGGHQWGYMKWYFEHIPYFVGLNTNAGDKHLNNWWHYILDYNAGMAEEKRLQKELK